MTLKSPGLFFILTFANVNCFPNHSQLSSLQGNPQVEIFGRNVDTPWAEDWDLVDLGNNETNLIAKHRNNLVLNLVCTHPEGTNWFYENYFNFDNKNSDTRDCEEYKETHGTKFQKRTLTIRFEQNLSPHIAKARCTPYSYDSHLSMYSSWNVHPYFLGKQTIINIFVPGEKVLIRREEYASRSELRDYSSMWIPCLISDPREHVSLFAEYPQTGVREEIANAIYDPYVGFFSNQTLRDDVVYICSAGENESMRFVKYPGSNLSTSLEEFTVESLEENVLFLKVKEMKSHCDGTEYDIVALSLIRDLLLHFNHRRLNETKILHSKDRPIWIQKDSDTVENIKMAFANKKYIEAMILCIKEDTDSNKNAERGQVLRILKIELMRKNTLNQNIPSDESYFGYMSEDGIRYGRVSWKVINGDELVYMPLDGFMEYTTSLNESSNFICKYNENNFVYGRVRVELFNGTSFIVTNETLNTATHKRSESPIKTWIINLKLPLDAVAVKCEIPISFNSNFYVAAERRFQHLSNQNS